MSEPQRYWHWISHHRKLRYGDGREVVDGEELSTPTAEMCSSGLHASRQLHHAARYADLVEWSRDGYAVLCGVQLGDDAVHGDDKSVSRTRRCVNSRRVHISVFVAYAQWCAACAARAADYAAAADAAYAAADAAACAAYAAVRAAHYAAARAAYAACAAYAAAAARAAEELAQEKWWEDTLITLTPEGRIP
jgi:hypothetical protein